MAAIKKDAETLLKEAQMKLNEYNALVGMEKKVKLTPTTTPKVNETLIKVQLEYESKPLNAFELLLTGGKIAKQKEEAVKTLQVLREQKK